jgi:uncharacterized protein (TIGR03435 family)
MRRRLVVLTLVGSGIVASAQAPTYDVVSIRHDPDARCCLNNRSERPGGGFALSQGTIAVLIGLAYAMNSQDIVGLPDWATSEAYDVTATADRPDLTMDDRRAMKQALLADRFSFRAHVETRVEEGFALVTARDDGRLGPGAVPHDVDCVAVTNAARAARLAGEPPPAESFDTGCNMSVTRSGLGGAMPMSLLADLLATVVQRPVVDKTNIEGTFRVKLSFDQQATRRADAPPSDLPSIFVALPEQLGLRLEPARVEVRVLVVDQIERPTPN